MEHNPRITRIATKPLVVTLALAVTTVLSTSAADSRAPLGVDNVHGAPDFLRDSLVQSSDEAREVAAAIRRLAIGDHDAAFAGLQSVLARPYDEFTTMFPGKPSTSTYRAAFEVLRTTDYRTRLAWSNAMGNLADTELRQAVSANDATAILKVAHDYPFTQAGLKALALSAVGAARRGQPQLAHALLKDMSLTYERTRVPFNSSQTLRIIRDRLDSDNTASRTSHFATDARQSVPQLAIPWPKALWKWEESLWLTPQSAAAVSSLAQPENRSLLSWDSWSPVIAGDIVLLRTPTRIMAFDKLSGAVNWSLKTDTLTPLNSAQQQSEPSALTGQARTRVKSSVTDLLRMDDWGSFTVAADNVYFIDHFRRLQTKETRTNSGRRQLLPRGLVDIDSQVDNGGGKLVCLQLRPTPRVLWSLGDAPEFSYQFEGSSLKSPPADADTSDVQTSEPEFAGHRFAAPPLAHDGSLFVLTVGVDAETWLNCLTANTGRLVWRRPIAREPQGRHFYGNGRDVTVGASVCGIDGDVIICELRSGVMIGTRMLDGQLLWATNFREDAGQPGILSGRHLYSATGIEGAGSRFKPLLHEGQIVWSSPGAAHVQCVDSQTGQIQWSVPKEISATGPLEGSRDQYAAGAWQDRIAMVGDRHVRWLATTDGSQIAVTDVDPQCGRAACAGPTCLVPLLDGSLALLDARTGNATACSREIAATAALRVTGSVTTDADVVCFTTPTSIETLSLQVPQAGSDEANTTPESYLRNAMTTLMAGNREAGIQRLRALHARSLPGDQANSLRTQATYQLAQTILRQAELIRSELATSGRPLASLPDLKVLQELPLTPRQRLRMLLLSEGRASKTDRTAFAAIDLVEVAPGLRTDRDVAVLAKLASDDARMIIEPLDTQSTRFSQVELAILFPQLIGEAEKQVAYAKLLQARGLFSAAELFLIASHRAVNTEDAQPLMEAQQVLRESLSNQLNRPIRQQAHATKIEATSAEVEERELHPNSLSNLVNARPQILNTPDWYPHRLALPRRSRNLHTVDMTSGAVSVPVKLPAAVDVQPVILGQDTPGLIPVCGTDHAGVITLLDPQHPRQLWWKRIDRDVTDASPLTTGPFGPGYMVVATSSQLQCMHPLTGRTLWQRRMALGNQILDDGMLYFGRDGRGSLKISGDDRAVCVFGSKGKSCTVLDTKTGEIIRVLPLAIPGSDTAIVSGRMVLYPRDNKLVLIDLLTGRDIIPPTSAVRVQPNSSGQLLSRHRAAFISDAGELVVLDLATGQSVLRCPLGSTFDASQLVGLKVIERGTRLFVIIKTARDQRYEPPASSRMNDPRLERGRLFCVDSETQRVLWSRKSVASVMPPIYGDPCNLLLIWSRDTTGYLSGRRRQPVFDSGEISQPGVHVTILNADTGKALLDNYELSPSEPLRCVHSQSENRIEIYMQHSVVSIRY